MKSLPIMIIFSAILVAVLSNIQAPPAVSENYISHTEFKEYTQALRNRFIEIEANLDRLNRKVGTE